MKGLILQGFASLYMSWCSYEMAILHVKQNISKHAKSRFYVTGFMLQLKFFTACLRENPGFP